MIGRKYLLFFSQKAGVKYYYQSFLVYSNLFKQKSTNHDLVIIWYAEMVYQTKYKGWLLRNQA